MSRAGHLRHPVLALALGVADVKVAAIAGNWPGYRGVWPLASRSQG